MGLRDVRLASIRITDTRCKEFGDLPAIWQLVGGLVCFSHHEEIVDAHRDVEVGHSRGKVVVTL